MKIFWKFNKNDKTMLIPRRIYAEDNIYVVSDDYSLDDKQVSFNGFRGAFLGDGRGEKHTLDTLDVRWFEYSGSRVKSFRTPECELRNYFYKKWFSLYSDGPDSCDDYISWHDYCDEKMGQVYKNK